MKGRTTADFPAAHPGDVLKEDFLLPLGMTQYALARALGVSQLRISQIIRGKRSITADTALRLARYFGTTAEFWLGMQASCDLAIVREKNGPSIEKTIAPRAA